MDQGASTNRFGDDRGFGLVEAVVALVIIFGLILTLMRTFDSSVRVLVETRRASAANQFATELLERAQALEWQHMGLAASTNGTSCANKEIGCTTYLAEFPEVVADGFGGWNYDGETVVFSNADTFKPFLDFHETVDRDGTDFDRYIFVTSVDDDGDGSEDLRRITAVVRWNAPSGHQRSVEQAAMVAPFVRPSQPLIRTDVAYSAGSVDVNGFTYEGGIAKSSQWAGSVAQERTPFEAGLALPSFQASALSDYVSEGRAFAEGSSIPHLLWFGADGLEGTADDIRTFLDPSELSLVADDDPLTTPGLVINSTVQPLPAVVQRTAFPEDLYLVQVEKAGPLASGAASNGSVTARVAAEDNQGLADGLPYATVDITDSEKTVIGFLEYGDTGSRTFYETHWGTAFPMAEFGFSLWRRADRSGNSVLGVTGTADRSSSAGDETTTGSIKFSSPNVELLRDDVMDLEAGGNKFNGWVVLSLPDVTVTGITAGEGALALPDPVSATDLVVSVWDPAAGAYVDTVIDYDSHGSSCDTVPAPIQVAVGTAGAPLAHEVNVSPLPWLSYEVVGTITINPWCLYNEADPRFVDVTAESTWETVGPMVAAQLEYRVLDKGTLISDPTADPIELFDLTLDWQGEQMQLTSVHVTPES